MASNKPALLICLLLAPLLALAEGPAYRLRSDQGPAPAYAPGGVRPLTAVGDRLFFVGTDPSNGTEVWTSDGSAVGTHLVRDIFPGPDIVTDAGIPETDPRRNPTPGSLVGFNGILFFPASDSLSFATLEGIPRCVLWRSDGSGAGTLPVVDPGRADVPVLPCRGLNLGNVPQPMTVSGGRLFFGAYRGESGPVGLFSTDGTEAGTRYLTSLESPDGWSSRFADVSGVLAFQGYDSIHGYGLWRSDGTPEGTRFVAPFDGPLGKLVAIGGSVAVEVDPPGASIQLWLVDLESGNGTLLRTLQWELTGIASVGSTIVFSVYSGFGGSDNGVWGSDGTRAGTTRLSSLEGVSGLAFAGDVLVGASSAGLFRTDGTVGGTSLVKNLNYADSPTSVGSRVWFAARDTNGVLGVWQSDGTSAGTHLVSSATGGSGFVAIGSRVFFVGTSGESMEDPHPAGIVWSSDGTAQGTGPLVPAGGPSAPANSTLLAANGQGAFFASVSSRAWEGVDLWFSDGRPAGAVRVASNAPGSVRGATMLHGKLICMIEGAKSELWQSDGTDAGTTRLASRELLSGESTRTFTDFGSTGEAVVIIQNGSEFSGGSFTGPVVIWRTDGSSGGTTIAQFSPGDAEALSRAGNRLVFPFYSQPNGLQLFSTDGTVANSVPFAAVGSYSSPVASGNALFFVGSGSSSSSQALWKTDGTGPGTSSLANVTSINSLVAGPNGSVYFLAPGSNGGPRLWRSDGTTAGTVSLVDLPPNAQLFPTSGAMLFFTAAGPAGQEIWQTDGTQEGTRMIRDLAPGVLGSNPTSVVSIGKEVLFAANDGESGYELWRSDGTEGGTRLVEDLALGPGSSSPAEFVLGCNLVYFTADADGIGREQWAVPLSAIDPAARGTGCSPPVQGPGKVPVKRHPR